MRSEGRITRENAYDLIKLFAKEYRKELGKASGEIIFVGGGSIMLNYKFRDATQDFDVILKTASGVKDVIARFADEQGLPEDWMNSDFMKTASYSAALSEVSRHYATLNNGTLEIRTVSGVYLIAMKLRAHRDYRNDISDAIGILIEERDAGNEITQENIKAAYQKLYKEALPEAMSELMEGICHMDLTELKKEYQRRNDMEQEIGGKIITYRDDGANINVGNVETVIERIKEKMKS